MKSIGDLEMGGWRVPLPLSGPRTIVDKYDVNTPPSAPKATKKGQIYGIWSLKTPKNALNEEKSPMRKSMSMSKLTLHYIVTLQYVFSIGSFKKNGTNCCSLQKVKE